MDTVGEERETVTAMLAFRCSGGAGLSCIKTIVLECQDVSSLEI